MVSLGYSWFSKVVLQVVGVAFGEESQDLPPPTPRYRAARVAMQPEVRSETTTRREPRAKRLLWSLASVNPG